MVGGIIGICTALVAFRQTFASIFDFRFNHLLLPRATSIFHRQPFLPLSGRGPYFSYKPMPELVSYDLPFTREGGWGYGGGEQMVGAPGDAAVLNTGSSLINQGGSVTGTTGHGNGRGFEQSNNTNEVGLTGGNGLGHSYGGPATAGNAAAQNMV